MKIFIADEHVLFRESLVSLFEDQPDIDVVGEASLLDEAVSKAAVLKPDVILLEATFSDGDTLEAIKSILADQPDTSIIIFTNRENENLLFDALQIGVKGYLLKKTSKPRLLDAIRGIERGEPALTRAMMGRVLAEYVRISKLVTNKQSENCVLTYREVEVLQKLALGNSNREIAEDLSISENTVRVHVRNILDKLHVRSRYEAGDYARRLGLVSSTKNAKKM